MRTYAVEKVWEGKRVTHFRVSRGAKGGEMVTVRVSDFGVYCCLTCIRIDCPHAEAAREFDLQGTQHSTPGADHEEAAKGAA